MPWQRTRRAIRRRTVASRRPTSTAVGGRAADTKRTAPSGAVAKTPSATRVCYAESAIMRSAARVEVRFPLGDSLLAAWPILDSSA